MLFFEFKGFDN